MLLKRHIIAILMLSPFYFTMTVRQRLGVVTYLCRRADDFSTPELGLSLDYQE
jgi:hypothetical protein